VKHYYQLLFYISVNHHHQTGEYFSKKPKMTCIYFTALKNFKVSLLLISVDPSEHGGGADICDKLAEVLDDDNGV
jgi:hypothetical protein